MTEVTTPDARTTVDFDEFHRVELPRRLDGGNGAIAAAGASTRAPLAFRNAVTGSAYTYRSGPDGPEVVEGEDGAKTVIEIDPEGFAGLATDMDTAPGLIYRNLAKAAHGNVFRFIQWEPVLRAMYHGRPPYDPDSIDLRDRDGGPLDTGRTFTLGSDQADMEQFLHEAGYLVVKNVFSESEVADMRAAADRLEAGAVEGDKKTWWGRNADGESVLTRHIEAGAEPVFRELYSDPRMTMLAGLSEFDLTAREGGSHRCATVLWKRPEMTEGLGNLPWHVDCGMGGHAQNCPIAIVTICLTDGSPEAGALRAVPGSWRYANEVADPTGPRAPVGVPFDVTAGDVTLHYSDSLHASPPPTGDGPYRISALMGFVRRDVGTTHHAGERHYNDPLLEHEGGQVRHLRDYVAGT